jgi:hypothetical protein
LGLEAGVADGTPDLFVLLANKRGEIGAADMNRIRIPRRKLRGDLG